MTIHKKYDVRRFDGKDRIGEKHDGCYYYVLDLNHDPHAKSALAAYANSVEVSGDLAFAQDVRDYARLDTA